MAEPQRKKQRNTDSAGFSNVPLLPDAPFRFLDLPGEIRNRVYKFAREDETTPILIKRCRNTPPHGFPDEEHSPRQYMSLTQVSRQIRDEFRPIYHEQTNVKVSTYDLAGYLRDALEVDHIEGKSVAGNISVELCVFGAPFAISFMRLLNLFASSVHLRLSFVTNGLYGGTSLAEPLNEMLRTEKDALVLEQSRSPVSEIALVKHDWGWQFFTIYAFVKESAWEEWMDEWDDAVAYTCLPMRRDMVEQGKAWARSIGLSLSNDDSISSVLRFKKACTDSERAEGSQVGSLKLGDLFLKQIEAVYEY